jgi:hypothetical protein
MKLAEVLLERISAALQRTLQNGLITVLKNCEVCVQVVIRPAKEDKDARRE